MSSDKLKRPNYDQPLKRLLARAHDQFLSLVAPGLEWRAELPTGIQFQERHADLVWRVAQPNGSEGIVHIELQTKAEADIGERMTEYGFGLWLRERLPVLSLVVFLCPTASVPQSPFVIAWQGRERLRYEFGVIRLWELSPDPILATADYGLWPLAGVMGEVTPEVTPETTAELAERIAEAPLPRPERTELLESLVSLIGLRLPRESLVDALRRAIMAKDLLKEGFDLP